MKYREFSTNPHITGKLLMKTCFTVNISRFFTKIKPLAKALQLMRQLSYVSRHQNVMLDISWYFSHMSFVSIYSVHHKSDDC